MPKEPLYKRLFGKSLHLFFFLQQPIVVILMCKQSVQLLTDFSLRCCAAELLSCNIHFFCSIVDYQFVCNIFCI